LVERRLSPFRLGDPRVRLVLQLVGAVAAIGVIWYSGPRLLRRLDFFRIRRVEIAGLQYLAPAKVMGALGLDSRSSVFDDLGRAAWRLKELPGVESAELRRRLPGTLEIVLKEAVPVALAPRSTGMALLDSSGQVLPFDPAASAPDLPIAATPDRVVARVLASVLLNDPVLFARIRAAWRVQDDVILDLDGRKLWLSPAVTAEDIRAVMAVAQDLARQGRNYQELDGRFAGQVIVRRAGV
jgi:cell division septal protein FtsQ